MRYSSCQSVAPTKTGTRFRRATRLIIARCPTFHGVCAFGLVDQNKGFAYIYSETDSRTHPIEIDDDKLSVPMENYLAV